MQIGDLVKVDFRDDLTAKTALIIDTKHRPWDEVPSILVLFEGKQYWIFRSQVVVTE